MRIGMLVDAYKPHISGVTNYIAINKRFLESRGHEVFVFTFGGLRYPDDEQNIIRSPGIQLTGSGYSAGFGYTRAAQRLLNTLDVVHVHHPFLSGWLAQVYCKPRRIPIVFTHHTRYDLYARVYLKFIPYPLAFRLMRWRLARFYRVCDLVIAPSAGAQQMMQAFGAGAVEVVPNGVDLTPFSHAQPMPRAELGFDSEDVVLAFTGRIGQEKNLAFLLSAFADAVEAAPQARLLLIGEGPQRSQLTRWVAQHDLGGRVHFTGLVPYVQVPRYLAAADAFVTASVTEVHPLAIIEAMATGLPVLGIDSPGLSDTVQDGVTGFLTCLDHAAYVSRLVALGTQHEQRRQLGAHSRQAAGLYAIERTGQIMLEHYQRVVRSSVNSSQNPKHCSLTTDN
jgi:glycosyltransferase involved in cell wall biosynthesis